MPAQDPGGSGTLGAGGRRSSLPEKWVMECILPASSSPATRRARGREPSGRNGPPRRPSPSSAPGSRDGALRPAVRRRVRRQPVGAAGGGGAEGGHSWGRRWPRCSPRGRGRRWRPLSRCWCCWADSGPVPWSGCLAALLSTQRPRRREPGEELAVARLPATAGWMRDLRGPGGGQRLTTPRSGSPSRRARPRWPWPPTLTT